MRLLFRQLKRGRGPLRLVPETPDDLFHLRALIEPGDRVTAWTTRKTPAPGADRARPSAERRVVRITLEAEEAEFHASTHRLRVPGRVVEPLAEGVSGGRHTLNIGLFDEVEVEKAWRAHHLARVEEALEADRGTLLILTVEEGLAVAGELRAWGVEERFTVEMGYGKGPGQGSGREEFFRRVAESLARERAETILVAGPGFAKEDLLAHLRRSHPAIAAKATVATCRSTGPPGFQELLRTGSVDRLVKAHRLAAEAKAVETLLAEVAKEGGRGVYGLARVEEAAARGAVDHLLIADPMVRGREALLESVERARGKVTILSGDGEPAKRLKGLGGAGAVLRY